MTNTFNLGMRDIACLEEYLCAFFNAKGMKAECAVSEAGTRVINATIAKPHPIDRMFGSNMACHVELKELGDGRVEVTAGKGLWAGKITGAAIAVWGLKHVPVIGWPFAILGALTVAKNAYDQASLPQLAVQAAGRFLA